MNEAISEETLAAIDGITTHMEKKGQSTRLRDFLTVSLATAAIIIAIVAVYAFFQSGKETQALKDANDAAQTARLDAVKAHQDADRRILQALAQRQKMTCKLSAARARADYRVYDQLATEEQLLIAFSPLDDRANVARNAIVKTYLMRRDDAIALRKLTNCP